MPFYEYQCSRCGHHHEELQKVTDKPLRKCPECGRLTLTRLMSAPVFRLKGGGWYETDFKSDKEGKRNLAGEKEPAVAKTDSTDKPVTTPAKTADVAPAKTETPAKTTTAAKKQAKHKSAAKKPARSAPKRR
jgi:putative FmdB family regulatory protein